MPRMLYCRTEPKPGVQSSNLHRGSVNETAPNLLAFILKANIYVYLKSAIHLIVQINS